MKKLMAAVVVGALGSAAAAQEPAATGHGAMAATGEGTHTEAPPDKPFFQTEINLSGDYAFNANVDGGGDVSVARSLASLWVSHDFTASVRGSLLIESEFSWYDFSDATGVIAGTGKPFSQLLLTDINPGVSCKVNDQWTAVSGLLFRFAGENEVDVGDAFTWGGYVAGRYSPGKNFSITLGVRANSRLEEDWRILPAIAMDWNVSEKVKVQFIPAVGGEGFRVTSTLNDKWSFLIDGEYESREFRLNDEAPLASGIVRDWRFTIGAGVVWKPCDKVRIMARAGAVAWQEFRIDDRNGDQQSEVNTDPAPYIYLGGTINF